MWNSGEDPFPQPSNVPGMSLFSVMRLCYDGLDSRLCQVICFLFDLFVVLGFDVSYLINPELLRQYAVCHFGYFFEILDIRHLSIVLDDVCEKLFSVLFECGEFGHSDSVVVLVIGVYSLSFTCLF